VFLFCNKSLEAKMAAIPGIGDAGGAGGTAGLDAAMDKALQSMQEMMEKQIKFTTESNPLKAADSIAKGSRVS
jgi:hypothetical protein